MSGPVIFDRRLLRLRRRRAAALVPADFLLARAADDLAERLSSVVRRFDLAADLGTPGKHLRQALAASGKVGILIVVDALADFSLSDTRAREERPPFPLSIENNCMPEMNVVTPEALHDDDRAAQSGIDAFVFR